MIYQFSEGISFLLGRRLQNAFIQNSVKNINILKKRTYTKHILNVENVICVKKIGLSVEKFNNQKRYSILTIHPAPPPFMFYPSVDNFFLVLQITLKRIYKVQYRYMSITT